MNIPNGVVRIERNGRIRGTGFVVSADGLIATCAHVLGHSRPEKVDVVFQGSDKPREALVESWYAKDDEDIALLRISGSLPVGILPLSLGSSLGTEGHPLTTFGYPEMGEVEGIHAAGTILGRGARTKGRQPLLQLRSSEITEGFSGAPVWDEVRQRVVGMVVIAAERDELGKLGETAFATPAETILTIFPSLHVSDVCPYRELAAFTEADANFFFGRQRVIDTLVDNLQNERRFLAVFGASGSGKSSVVQAGLIPHLHKGKVPGSDRWEIIVTRPIDPSFEEHLANLDQVSVHVALVIDQFEELFVDYEEAKRAEVIAHLVLLLKNAPHVTLIVVMRDDFYNLFVQREELGTWLKRALVNVWPTLKLEEVKAIIREPAQAVGWQFEDGLIEMIVNDVLETSTKEPKKVGSGTMLPLLEFALTQLWERREDGRLTRNAYQRMGGVTGGLTQWANSAYYTFDERLRPFVRRIFTDLIHIGDEGQHIPNSRRPRALSTLIHTEIETSDIYMVVRRLVTFRLLVISRDSESNQEIVEIIHDALLLEWGRLSHWIEEDQRFLSWRQEFEKRTRAWIESNKGDPSKRDSYRLIGGSDLTEALDWVKTRAQGLSQSEHEFIQASQERQKNEEQQSRRYTRRTVLAWLGVIGLVAGVGSGIALSTLLRKPAPGRTALPPLSLPYTLNGHTDAVLSVAWSPDGKQLASASADKTVRVWDATSGKPLLTYRGHTDAVLSVAWSPDGKWLASASADKTAQVWDAANGLPLLTYRGHTQRVTSVAWSPSDKRLASASSDMTVQVWDAVSGSLLLTYRGQTNAVLSVAWSPDGKRLASASTDTTVQVSGASIATNIIQLTYRGNGGQVTSVVWSPDGKRLASASGDTTVQVWDAATGQTLLTYTDLQDDGVISVAWSTDGKRLASGGAGYDATVQVWDATTGQTLLIYRGHTQLVTGVVWSPDSKRLASASGDGTVQVWDAASGSHLLTLAVETNNVVWSPDGKRLASAGDNTTVQVWNATSGALLHTYKGHTDLVNSVAWSPNGRRLASASSDTTVRVWDAVNGSLLLIYRGHTDVVESVAWSPDGRHLASAGDDTTVQIWDAATGQTLLTYLGHSQQVNSVAWSLDGKWLASASDDTTVQLWLW